MKALEAIDVHLKNRARELERFKEEGRKIIGYYPGGYVPDEIILAWENRMITPRGILHAWPLSGSPRPCWA